MELRLSNPINHHIAEWRILSCCSSIKLCKGNTLHGYLCVNTAVVYALLCNAHNINSTWCCSATAALLDSQYYEWKHWVVPQQPAGGMNEVEPQTHLSDPSGQTMWNTTPGALSCLVSGGACFAFITVGSPHCATHPPDPEAAALCSMWQEWHLQPSLQATGHNCVNSEVIMTCEPPAHIPFVEVLAVFTCFWSAWILCVKMCVTL